MAMGVQWIKVKEDISCHDCLVDERERRHQQPWQSNGFKRRGTSVAVTVLWIRGKGDISGRSCSIVYTEARETSAAMTVLWIREKGDISGHGCPVD